MKRNTPQRIAIESVFKKYDRPLGVTEILDYGRKFVHSLNQATVYRNLKLLVENGWVIPINHPSGGVLYERTGKAHHHHFHCRECNRVFELPGCSLKEKGIAPDGFTVEDHKIFLVGTCAQCGG